MFDMESVGRKISNARREKNMTQMELADKLNISFQAVSNWERGLSMPDIAKLPELSELLGITVDEILGKPSRLINKIIAEDDDGYEEITYQEFKEAVPLLKPEQVNETYERIDPPFDFSDIEELLPFLGRETCDNLFIKLIKQDDFEHAQELAPFISRELRNKTYLEYSENTNKVSGLLPFIDRNIRDEAAMRRYKQGGLYAINEYMPFISKHLLKQIAETEYEKNGLKKFECIAPFINRDYLQELAEKAIEKDGIKAISHIAPFLKRDFLRQFVKERYL